MFKNALLKDFTQAALKKAQPLKKAWTTVTWGYRSKQDYIDDNIPFFVTSTIVRFGAVTMMAGVTSSLLNHGAFKPLLNHVSEDYRIIPALIAVSSAGIMGDFAVKAASRAIGETIIEDPKNTLSFSKTPYPKRKEFVRKVKQRANRLQQFMK